MELKQDWITEGTVDFEYKKYRLLAYLQYAQKVFGKRKLFPTLSDLVAHYRHVTSLNKDKSLLFDAFPAKVTKADFKKLELQYKSLIADDDLMREVQEIIDFAIPNIKDTLNDGRDLYESIEPHFDITSIGISPLYIDEGYTLINTGLKKKADIYRYKISVFEKAEEVYRGVNFQFVETRRRSLAITYEQMKLDLVKRFKTLPNPATYLITSSVKYPYIETVIPIAKRLLIRYVSTSEKKD